MTKEFSIAQEISIAQLAVARNPSIYFSGTLEELMSGTLGMKRDWKSFNVTAGYSSDTGTVLFKVSIVVEGS